MSLRVTRLVFMIIGSFVVGTAQSLAAEKVRILSPADGSEIVLSPSERKPAERPVYGDLLGFSTADVKSTRLRVHVDIQTDKWYPQGIARVREDGTWSIRKAYFGGAVHTIRARVIDSSRASRAEATATVTLVE
jgi:hypothetical protein